MGGIWLAFAVNVVYFNALPTLICDTSIYVLIVFLNPYNICKSIYNSNYFEYTIELKQILNSFGYSLGCIDIQIPREYLDVQ